MIKSLFKLAISLAVIGGILYAVSVFYCRPLCEDEVCPASSGACFLPKPFDGMNGNMEDINAFLRKNVGNPRIYFQ